jgi:hypothetical protein
MIARKTTAIERATETERTKGMRRGTILKSVKIKNVSPKTDRFKVRSLREFGYSKEGR